MKFYEKYLPLLELNNSKYSVIALTGGRGSMKTGHALRGVLLCSTQQKKKTCFFRETKETLNDSLKAELDGIIEAEFSDRGFLTTNDYIKHYNGSYMFFKGLKEVNLAAIENLKGIATTTDFFIVDEAQAVSQKVWDVLIPTLRKAGCVLIVIYNRISDKLPVESALFLDYKTMTAPEGTYFVEVNYPEIMHLNLLSKQFVDRAELLKKNKLKQYEQDYLNKPKDMAENTVTKYFTKENIKNLKYIDDIDLHITCDFNSSAPMSWAIAHKDENKVYFIDEIVMENTDTREATREFLRRYGNHKGVIIIGGDASGDYLQAGNKQSNYSILCHMLDKAGLRWKKRIRPKNPIITNRVAAWNNRVLTIQGERCLFIDPKCKWLIHNIYNLLWKEGAGDQINLPTSTQIRNNPELNFLGHIFDAASYLVEIEWPVVKHKLDKIITKQNYVQGSAW